MEQSQCLDILLGQWASEVTSMHLHVAWKAWWSMYCQAHEIRLQCLLLAEKQRAEEVQGLLDAKANVSTKVKGPRVTTAKHIMVRSLLACDSAVLKLWLRGWRRAARLA